MEKASRVNENSNSFLDEDTEKIRIFNKNTESIVNLKAVTREDTVNMEVLIEKPEKIEFLQYFYEVCSY